MMLDFAKARQTMVDCQIRVNDVTSPRIVAAFATVPRESFVPDHLRALSYLDDDLCLDGKHGQGGRYLLEAVVLARMIASADIAPGSRVLDIGVATGYSSAILAAMGLVVTSLEEDPRFYEQAKALLAGQADVVSGTLSAGAAGQGPFDVILVQGSVEVVPDMLLTQLKDKGRLVVIKGHGRTGKCVVLTKLGDEISEQVAFDAAAPELPGFRKAPSFTF